jgi:porphobilinogen synthase
LHPALREALADSQLHPRNFVAPLFVRLGKNVRNPIASMPGVSQMSPDVAVEEIRKLADLGVAGFILFGVTDKDKKDAVGSHAHDPENAVCQTLRAFGDSKLAGKLLAITDLCYCEYTSHGHCGVLTSANAIDNAATISRLGQQAVNHAKAGADIVAPSGKMDHAVAAIRAALDAEKLGDTAILSYAVKYASSFYGPFRDAAESPPQFGDRRSYQMDFRRDAREAIAAAAADIAQGADMVMVKPGVPYLDILRSVRDAVSVPCAVYHVSGEYAMLKAAAANKWIDEKPVVLETMHAFKRAGASLILTYYAADVATWIK